MNNQVPNTDPSLSAKQRVRKIYPNSFYSNCANKIISENGVGGITLGISWDDAASKLPAAVSEVMLPPNGLCWFGDGSCKKPQTNTSFYCADHEHKKPVAPQGTVEGETPHRWAGMQEANDWIVGNCSCGWTYQLPSDGCGHLAALLGYWSDHFTAAMRESVAPPSVAMQDGNQELPPIRVNNEPPIHWSENDGWKRHPQTTEEWDWNKDHDHIGVQPDRSEQRLNFAMDRADPHAPDQMALVLRIDLLRLHGRMITAEAFKESRLRRDAVPVAEKAVSGEGSGVPALIATLEAAALKATQETWTRTGMRIYCSRGIIADIPTPQKAGVFSCSDNADYFLAASPENVLKLTGAIKAALSPPLQGWISFQQEWPPLRETVEVYFPEPELALCRRELEELADDDMSEPENILWDIVCDQERITAGAIWRKHIKPVPHQTRRAEAR